jgi:hypothetical protein
MNVIREKLEGKVQSWTIYMIKIHYFLDGNCADEGKLMTLEPRMTSKSHGTSSSLGDNFSQKIAVMLLTLFSSVHPPNCWYNTSN